MYTAVITNEKTSKEKCDAMVSISFLSKPLYSIASINSMLLGAAFVYTPLSYTMNDLVPTAESIWR